MVQEFIPGKRPDLTNPDVFKGLMDKGRLPVLLSEDFDEDEGVMADASKILVLIPPARRGYEVSFEEATAIAKVRKEILSLPH